MYQTSKLTKDITIIATMAAVIEAAKNILAAVPGIEIVTLLFMMYTLIFGLRRTMLTAIVFDIVENLIWGIGIWSIAYCYIWPLLILVTWFFRKSNNKWVFVLIAAMYGLLFGALCAIITLCMGGLHAAIAWWIAGIPYDIVHGFTNGVVMALLYTPLLKAMNTIVTYLHLPKSQ